MSNGASTTTVTLTIVRGSDLVQKDGIIASMAYGPSSDPYVKVYMGSKMAGRTSTIYKSLDPEWNEQVLMEFPVTDGEHELRLAIIDEYRDHEDNKMGEVIIPLEDIGLGKILHKKFEINNCEGCDEATGKLELIVMWEPRGETQAARAQKEKQEAEARKRKKEEKKKKERAARQKELEEQERRRQEKEKLEKDREEVAFHSLSPVDIEEDEEEDVDEAYYESRHRPSEGEGRSLIDFDDDYKSHSDEGDLETGTSEDFHICSDERGHRSRCRVTAVVILLVVLPVLYVSLLVVEYRNYGWDRFKERAYPAPIHNVTVQVSGTEVVTHPFRIGWLLPLCGFLSGLLTNIAPVQAGVILAPLFQKHAVTVSSEATLALVAAFHFIGNGLCGGLAWSSFEPRLFAYRAIWIIVPCSWLGYILGITEPFNVTDNIERSGIGSDRLQTRLRVTLGIVLLGAGVATLLAGCAGGIEYLFPRRRANARSKCCTATKWIMVSFISIAVGYFFLANIGGGVAVSTFLMLGLILGVSTERALVTACVISGWASLLPLLVQWFKLGGRPVIRLLMAAPCLWMGAIVAPWLSQCGGRFFRLGSTVFIFFTSGTLLLSYGIAHLRAQAEDLDVDTEPIFSL